MTGAHTVDLVWPTEIFITKRIRMIKLTEILKGDDVENFDKVTSEICYKLHGLSEGHVTIVNVDDNDMPTRGTMDGVPFISESVLTISAETTKIYPEMVNDVYKLVGKKIQELGYGEYPFKFRLKSFVAKVGIEFWLTSSLPHNFLQHFRYDLPSLQYILSGEYSLVIPEDVLPKISPEIEEWSKVKLKRASVLFEAYKKGKVRDHTYEIKLTDDGIKVRGIGEMINDPKDLEVYIFPKLVSVDEKPYGNVPINLLGFIEMEIKERFEKHKIKVMWF
jgi:hypothetical protein